jgi:hypothetical protein
MMGGTSIEKLMAELEKVEQVCSNCHRIRTESRRESSKDQRTLDHRARINEIKSAPCADCGLRFPPVAMDLDHIDGAGEKLIEIANMAHYPKHKIEAELKKVEVVCSNCHRLRTRQRFEKMKEEKIATGKSVCIDCSTPVSMTAKRCSDCAEKLARSNKDIRKRIDWPPIEELVSMIRELGYVKTAEKLDCSLTMVYIRVPKSKLTEYLNNT